GGALRDRVCCLVDHTARLLAVFTLPHVRGSAAAGVGHPGSRGHRRDELTGNFARTVTVLQWLWSASLLGACIGVAYKWTSVASRAFGQYLIGLTENIARINHSDAIVVFGLTIMALSRAADTFSVDALLGRVSIKGLEESGEYTWPIRAMWVV